MSDESERLPEGTLISHLLELRQRLMRAFIAVLLVFIPCAYYSNLLFEWFSRPIMKELPKGSSMITTNITASFTTPFKLSFVFALLLAAPYVLYQIWGFVAPGLYRREKRFARPLLASAIILFYCGASFAYWVVFPMIFRFFVITLPKNVTMLPDITNYMDIAMRLVVAFGVAFEVPVAVVLLVATGLVKVEKLTSIRGYVLIAIFVIAAMVTPPDAISQTIMALPMYALYEGGIIFARIVAKKPPDETDKTDS